MKSIKASINNTRIPAWATGQRDLLQQLSTAAAEVSARYNLPDDTATFIHDVDDVYEARAGRALLYALGGDDRLLELAHNEWDATTRYYDDATPPDSHPEYVTQLHGEYYNLGQAFEWFHQGEGNQALYEFGVADPGNNAQRDRAVRFADLFTGDDDTAPNFDRARQLLRSPFPSSVGPLHEAGRGWGHGSDVDFARMLLNRSASGKQRASLHPVIEDLEPDWHEDPARAAEVVAVFNRLILQSDTPTNLTATTLVTHAFLFTGDERYKRWVLDYCDAWLDRIRANDGIVPDNVGLNGKIGEHRGGQWWGGLYGWNSTYAADINFGGLTIAAECAVLLSGDMGYLDLLRSQLTMLLGHARTGEGGQLLVPGRYGPEGWTDYRAPRLLEYAHLYHASMNAADRSLIEQLRAGDVEHDWTSITPAGDRRSQQSEDARFQYYDNCNPDWPTDILQAESDYAASFAERIGAESRDHETLLRDNEWPPNPVVTKGLTQMTTGAPQTVYNGGLLRATVRWFDADRRRPGLPPDVAALVDGLDADSVSVQLVNLNSQQPRQLICQAGAFGEHTFGEIRTETVAGAESTSVDRPHVRVILPPGTSLRLHARLRRFSCTPAYLPPAYD